MASSVEEFGGIWREWLSAWETWWVEIIGLEGAADERVLVAMDIIARSKKDAVEIPM